ncbi:MAG: sensor histidine kinase [Intrasporangium sp.]|uniref:sensor histidine kinase n=1 Tax=Intrasporangium sp. TaxID=1925024 RepID=UPI002649E3CF|nr:sensor histidine kinase [Intrasporangium sp.]MDN5795032.1 sensor histidine kinase [Intrasporangium sp.]
MTDPACAVEVEGMEVDGMEAEGLQSGGLQSGRRSRRPRRNPWARFGWVIQSIWLLFLGFPVAHVLSSGRAWWWVALGLALVTTFAAIYAGAFWHLNQLDDEHLPSARVAGGYLLALVTVAVVSVPFVGTEGATYLPFITAFAMMVMPLRWGIAVFAVAVAVALYVSLALAPGDGSWVVAAIVVAVGVMTGGIRAMTDQGARYESMSRELALVAERERVARDVHDVLGHSLTVVTVKAELAERLIDIDPERARAELADIQALSRQALAEIRETVGGLRAARLSVELASARTALTGAGIRAGVPVGADEVDPRHRTVLAWVLREAVTNVVRHSGATTCRIDLGPNLLRVMDDGRGVDGSPPGNGLRGVRERVESSGGRLSVGPGENGHGTVLEVVL